LLAKLKVVAEISYTDHRRLQKLGASPAEVCDYLENEKALDAIPSSRYIRCQLAGTPMTPTATMLESRHESKTRFLNAAVHVIRAKGYSATRIEDVCEAAGLTKGSFFHHFDSKEALALDAVDYWTGGSEALFASAPYRDQADPLDRLLAYVDFRKEMLTGDLVDFTCLAGTMVQEVYDTHPALREACNRCITGHAGILVPDIEEAMRQRGMHPHPQWTAESLALYTQATIQGAFILAKATNGAAVAAQCIDHLHNYLELLFVQPAKKTVGTPLKK
jgi:TetR/AcrR family transcriptional regulator, transcriptional repressor for nem operon